MITEDNWLIAAQPRHSLIHLLTSMVLTPDSHLAL